MALRLAVGRTLARSDLLPGLTFSDDGRLGVDGRLGGHARPQQAFQAGIVEHDLHRHALHDLGEVAGGDVGRQQREFETARGRQAVDMAPQLGRMETVD